MAAYDFYIGLLIQCAKSKEEIDCPLKNIRRLTMEERLEYWNNLTMGEKKVIVNHHIDCICREK